MSSYETVHADQSAGDDCVVVILGASGDLTKRKLIPALARLSGAEGPGLRFKVLGVGLEPMSVDAFVASLREGAVADAIDADVWDEFASRLHYLAGDLTAPEFYRGLALVLRAAGASSNRLFYCSTPPSLAGPIVEGLAGAGLASETDGWTRVILEKPFGYDLESARALNARVAGVFAEHQVYRIDHYLGKETVQNLLVFRFGNTLFEPVWNRNYVDHVEITAAETVGVGRRAGYYEGAGALRDMVANHLLQLLTLTAMEPPVAFDADSVREAKVQVLRSIRPMSPAEVAQRTVRAQYVAGVVDGAYVPGYREESGVAANSTTETYAAVRFDVRNWRWAGVPFYLRTGKRLARQLTEINVHFRRTPHALFADAGADAINPNVLTLRIQPDEAVRMTIGAKRPGTGMRTSTVQMDFSYETGFGVRSPAAYETLLLDAVLGDATLFTRRDEVENEWRLITPILEAWRGMPPSTVATYLAGSSGPAAADALLAEAGHAWRPLVSKPAPAARGRTGVLAWPATRILRAPDVDSGA